MTRVVFDTNVYVSALRTRQGRGEEALTGAIDRRFELFVSVPILAEMSRILEEKFDWDREKVEAAVRFASTVAKVVRPTNKLALLDDEPDNRILECAVASVADTIVTGDRHLLRLHSWNDIAVLTLADFLGRCAKG